MSSHIDSILRAADLSDAAERAMLVDVLTDANREAEAALLLTSQELLAVDGVVKVPTLAELVAAIESEIARIGLEACEDNTEGLCVYADDLLPRGWLRISDGHGYVYGPAFDLLYVLRAQEDQGDLQETFDATWRALDTFSEEPNDSRGWPSDLWSIEKMDDYYDDSDYNPTTLIRFQTNDGEHWTCGAHGSTHCALWDAFRYDRIYDTREDAMAAAGIGEDEDDLTDNRVS